MSDFSIVCLLFIYCTIAEEFATTISNNKLSLTEITLYERFFLRGIFHVKPADKRTVPFAKSLSML